MRSHFDFGDSVTEVASRENQAAIGKPLIYNRLASHIDVFPEELWSLTVQSGVGICSFDMHLYGRQTFGEVAYLLKAPSNCRV